MTDTDDAQRSWLREMLQEAADGLGVAIAGQPVFGWRDRSISALATTETGPAWLRLVTEQTDWADGDFWTGNLDAAGIEGVAKPKLLQHLDWIEGSVSLRAELMSRAAGDRCSPTPELHTDIDLPAAWWAGLTESLFVLEKTSTTRTAVRSEDIEVRVLAFFGVHIDLSTARWSPAHADLHWANLMHPDLSIVDWEGWGMAPAGYDAATLYIHTLLVPETARFVHEQFRDVLDSPEGLTTQLYVGARLLNRVLNGDYPELAVPLHRHADAVISRLDLR